MVGKFR